MTWTPPTVDDLTTRFPVFAKVSPDLLQLIIEEATADVGVNWIEKDRTPAILYFAAHLLASQGHAGATGTGGGGAATTGAIKRRKVGDVETEFVGAAAVSAGGWGGSPLYDSTIYGQMFLRLLRRNFPAIAVV